MSEKLSLPKRYRTVKQPESCWNCAHLPLKPNSVLAGPLPVYQCEEHDGISHFNQFSAMWAVCDSYARNNYVK